MPKSVLTMFPFRSFIVSSLTFRSLIHFDFIFIYGICHDFFFFLFKLLFFFTLQCCIGFAIHQHASATGVHMFPILNPPLTSPYHPSGSSQCTIPKLPVSCIKPGLVIHFLYYIIHVSMPFSQIIHPSLSHRVQKSFVNKMHWSLQTPSSNNTRDDSTDGHHQMVNTVILI